MCVYIYIYNDSKGSHNNPPGVNATACSKRRSVRQCLSSRGVQTHTHTGQSLFDGDGGAVALLYPNNTHNISNSHHSTTTTTTNNNNNDNHANEHHDTNDHNHTIDSNNAAQG